MQSQAAGAIVDKIYEAAVVPELWPTVLEDLTTIGDGECALLFTINADRQKWLASPSAVEAIRRYIEQGWPERTTRVSRLFAARHAGFLSDLDVYTPEEMEREPVFTEFLRPEGYGWGAATAISVPTGEAIIFSVEKAYHRGPVDRASLHRLDALRPHLARSALLAGRMDLQRAQAIAQALSAIGLPGAVLRYGGKLHAANPLFESLIPTVIQDSRQRLSLMNPAADRILADALSRLATTDASHESRSIPLPAREGSPPMIVHLIPVRGLAQDIFSLSETIVIITPVNRKTVPNAEVLEGLFDLSPAEARVARAIAEGTTISAFAKERNLSRETIRTQLNAVFAKTGVQRQAQLANLLSGIIAQSK